MSGEKHYADGQSRGCAEYASLCRVIDSGGGVYKRILECRQMAENLTSLFPSDLPPDAENILDHLAYLDGWLLHLATLLPSKDSPHHMMEKEVAAGNRQQIYRNNHWVASGDLFKWRSRTFI